LSPITEVEREQRLDKKGINLHCTQNIITTIKSRPRNPDFESSSGKGP